MLTPQKIAEMDKISGLKPATSTAGSSRVQELQKLAGIQPPQEEPGLIDKLGKRFSQLGTGLKQIGEGRGVVGQPSKGIMGIGNVAGSVFGGIADVGDTAINAIPGVEPAIKALGQGVQKGINAYDENVLQPLGSKIRNAIGAENVEKTKETLDPVAQKVLDVANTPEAKQLGENVVDVARGIATLEGGKAVLESAPGKLVTNKLGQLKGTLTENLASYANDTARTSAKADFSSFLNSKKSLVNKVQEASKKNIDLVEEITGDKNLYTKIRPVEGKVQVDEAVDYINNNIDKALDIKRKIIPEVDRFVPKTPKEVIREKALADIKGTMLPQDEAALSARINQQIDALPDELSLQDIDTMRARARQSARDAKGQMKSDSEYAAMENALRDTEFEITDRLAFTDGKFKDLNDYIRRQIEIKKFLDKTLRGETVKGGRLGVYGGRAIGALAGATGGPLSTLASSEVGGYIAKIMMDRQLGNTLKMRFIREVTDDPAIIGEAEKILQGAKDYEIPQLPPKYGGEARGNVIQVEPADYSLDNKREYISKEPKVVQPISSERKSFDELLKTESPKDYIDVPESVKAEKISSLEDELIQLQQKEYEYDIQKEQLNSAIDNLDSIGFTKEEKISLQNMINAGVTDMEANVRTGSVSKQKLLRKLEDYGLDGHEIKDQLDQVIDLRNTLKQYGIKDIQNAIKNKQKEIESFKNEIQSLNPNMGRQNMANSTTATVNNIDSSIPQAPETVKPTRLISEEAYNQAKKNFKENMGRINSGIPVDQIKDLTVMAAYHIENGINSAIELGTQLAKEGYKLTKEQINKLYSTIKLGKMSDSDYQTFKAYLDNPSEDTRIAAQNLASDMGFTDKQILDKVGFRDLIDNGLKEKEANMDLSLPMRQGKQGISSIPKELQPLAEEAKKYSRLEDYMQAVKGGKTQYGEYNPKLRANIPAGYKNITEMGIDPEEMVTVYRGIDDLSGKVKKKINDGDFVTTDFDSALSYTGDPKNVVEMQVPAKTLYNSEPRDFMDEPFYTGAEYIYTKKSAKALPTDKELIDIWEKVNGKK